MTLPAPINDDPDRLAPYTSELDACATMADVDAVLALLIAAGCWPQVVVALREEQEQRRGLNVVVLSEWRRRQ